MTVLFEGSEISAFKPSGTVVEITTAGRFDANRARCSVRVTGTSAYAETETWSGVATIALHALHYLAQTGAGTYFEFYNGSTAVIRIQMPTTTTIAVDYWNGGSWVTLASAVTFASGTLQALDLLVTVNSASGSAALLVNGSVITSGSADLSGISAITKARLKGVGTTNGCTWNEVVVADASTVGWSSELEAPTADGSDTDGTGTYADVDEAVNSDLDYVALAAAGERRSFTSPARTQTSGAVKSVTASARCKRDASGPQNMRFYLTISGTRYYSPTIALTAGFDGYSYSWSLNPATSAAWLSAAAEAAGLNWGVEAVA